MEKNGEVGIEKNAEGGIEKNWEWGSGNDLKAEVGKWNVEEWKDK